MGIARNQVPQEYLCELCNPRFDNAVIYYNYNNNRFFNCHDVTCRPVDAAAAARLQARARADELSDESDVEWITRDSAAPKCTHSHIRTSSHATHRDDLDPSEEFRELKQPVYDAGDAVCRVH